MLTVKLLDAIFTVSAVKNGDKPQICISLTWHVLNDKFHNSNWHQIESIDLELSFDTNILWLGLLFVLKFCQETSKKQP